MGSWWSKLPLDLARRILAGELTSSETLVAVAVAVHPGASRAELVRHTGLGRRTVVYALDGRMDTGRQGLGAWLEPDQRTTTFIEPARFCRVGERDLVVLRQLPRIETLRAWAWAAIELESGRPWTRMKPLAAELAEAAGMTVALAKRALYGAGQRVGAIAAGLVDLVDGYLVRRHKVGRQQDRPRPCGEPRILPQSTEPSVRASSSPACASTPSPRVGAFFQEFRGRRFALLDLAHRWQAEANKDHQGGVEDFQEWLAEGRGGAHRGRTWAPTILAAVLKERQEQLQLQQEQDQQAGEGASVRAMLGRCYRLAEKLGLDSPLDTFDDYLDARHETHNPDAIPGLAELVTGWWRQIRPHLVVG